MRRLSIFILGFMIALFIQQASFAADPLKIGIINLERCLTETNEGKRIEALLKEKDASVKKQLDGRQEELMQLKKEIEKQSMMLSLDAQEDKRKEYETKARDFQMLYQRLGQDLKKTEREALKGFEDGLKGIVHKIEQQDGYDLILDSKVAVTYSEKLDITDQVIKEFNKLNQ